MILKYFYHKLNLFPNSDQKSILTSTKLIIIITIFLLMVITLSLVFSKSYQRDENYVTTQAKTEAQATGGDPCDLLKLWLQEAKLAGDKQKVQDIIQAQKFLGCRNKQKRQNR